MSLLNAWITTTAATVAVDTDGVARDGSRKAMSKLLTLPHLPAAIGMRGSAAVMAGLFHCCVNRGFDSFDELLEEVPRILGIVEESVPHFLRDPRFPDTELVVVGWSDRRSSMVARLFTKHGSEPDFTARDTLGFVAPFDQEGMAGIPTTAAAAEELARAQVRYMQRESGIGGGTLVLCRLDRYSISINHVCELGEEACRPLAHCLN